MTWVHTVNLEIFGRVLFAQNFADAKIRENIILPKWRNHCRLLIYVNHARAVKF